MIDHSPSSAITRVTDSQNADELIFSESDPSMSAASQTMVRSWELALSLAKGCISFDLQADEMDLDLELDIT
ncbi:hypothetical protein TDB9533_03995 [Thalassocella blandensis]|nr:hypothetical protein TDB9533_03995 [Thalassocella blandensis]